MKLDLADLSSVEAFAEDIRAKSADIDAFVNNAGAFHQPGKKTADGFDLVIGTNYIGVYCLSEKLLPYLETLGHEVRYINTISISYRHADIDYDDFYCEKHYRSMKVYARSKLCLARYTLALAKRYDSTNIRVFMSHPGMSPTPLGLNTLPGWFLRPAKLFIPLFNTPEKSSLSFAYIMSRDLPPGSLIGPAAVFGGWGYPKVNRVCRRAGEGAGELISFTEKELEKIKR